MTSPALKDPASQDPGTITVSTGYIPRIYALPFHNTDKRFSCLVAHRRF
ncbi:unnamed protein product, partial [marine sediment metagenome]